MSDPNCVNIYYSVNPWKLQFYSYITDGCLKLEQADETEKTT